MTLWRDMRIALRLFVRAPLPTAIALLSIAFSIGAAAVVFAAVKSVLIDRLPYARPEQLVQLRTEYPRFAAQSSGDWVDRDPHGARGNAGKRFFPDLPSGISHSGRGLRREVDSQPGLSYRDGRHGVLVPAICARTDPTKALRHD